MHIQIGMHRKDNMNVNAYKIKQISKCKLEGGKVAEIFHDTINNTT